MTLFQEELLQNSENVTNVKSVCNDGIIITHKIFIARNSEFIKHILIDIPIGDEAVSSPFSSRFRKR